MTMLYYTGVGSRRTPDSILDVMEAIAIDAASHGWILRSGGAGGADTAFEKGAVAKDGMCEIYLPHTAFRNHPSTLTMPTREARELAKTVHPAWDRLRPMAKSLIARNMHQVMGLSLTSPSSFLVCWTPDGCESEEDYSILTGGTGTAIAIASRNGIPVFNLKNKNRVDKLYAMIERKTV